MGTRPFPPPQLLEDDASGSFVPSASLLAWAGDTLLAPDSPLYNADHEHLAEARILWIWTNVAARRHGLSILGEAELLQHGQSRWSKARPVSQACEWWREAAVEGAASDPPDFAVTLYAPWCAEASDAEFMALVEHELYHCGQARDQYGELRYSQSTGEPIWCIRGHDVEEFVGVVRRYGAVSPGISSLLAAASGTPEVKRAAIAVACGTCKAA